MRSDVKYSIRYSTQFLRKNRIGTSALHAIPFMQVSVRATVDVEVDQTRAISLRSTNNFAVRQIRSQKFRLTSPLTQAENYCNSFLLN